MRERWGHGHPAPAAQKTRPHPHVLTTRLAPKVTTSRRGLRGLWNQARPRSWDREKAGAGEIGGSERASSQPGEVAE